MRMRALSIALPGALAVGAEEAAAREGVTVSVWVAAAIEQRLKLAAGQALLREWEAENGPVVPPAG
jgi:hypothetical protein